LKTTKKICVCLISIVLAVSCFAGIIYAYTPQPVILDVNHENLIERESASIYTTYANVTVTLKNVGAEGTVKIVLNTGDYKILNMKNGEEATVQFYWQTGYSNGLNFEVYSTFSEAKAEGQFTIPHIQ